MRSGEPAPSASVKNILAAAFLLAGLGGCTKSERVPGTGGVVMQVRQGAVGAFQGLRIGVTNIVEGDPGGKAGRVAVLALFVDGNPPQEETFRLRAGQKAALGGHSVYLEEIRGAVRGTVTLRVE